MKVNINISDKSDDEGDIGDVPYIYSLVMDFHSANKIVLMLKISSITKNDTFTPSTKKSKNH